MVAAWQETSDTGRQDLNMSKEVVLVYPWRMIRMLYSCSNRIYTDSSLVISEMVPGIIAVDVRNTSQLMRSQWFSTAQSDQGFMHSLLSTIALHRHVWGRGPIDTVLYHRARAIESVHSALANPDKSVGISDANIGAVFNLLSVEESLGSEWFAYLRPQGDNPNQREIHLKGLLRMIELRGGLMSMNSNRMLQAFILWCVFRLPHGTEQVTGTPPLQKRGWHYADQQPPPAIGFEERENVTLPCLNLCKPAQPRLAIAY